MNRKTNIKLDQLAGGAFREKVEAAFLQVAENIQDPNTEATKSREITIKVKITPGRSRSVSNMNITVMTKLVPAEAIGTQLLIGTDLSTGRVEVSEFDGQIPGQLRMTDQDPEEEPMPEVDEETGEVLNASPIDISAIMNRNKA